MKRIQSACICQTLHFMLKEDLEHEFAKKIVTEEVSRYKTQLKKSNTEYIILEEKVQPDDSIIIVLKKQYNSSPVGDYLN